MVTVEYLFSKMLETKSVSDFNFFSDVEVFTHICETSGGWDSKCKYEIHLYCMHNEYT
jgi:hypothetical protein